MGEWGAARAAFANLVIDDLFDDELIDRIRSGGGETVASRLDDIIGLRNYSLEDKNGVLHSSFPQK